MMKPNETDWVKNPSPPIVKLAKNDEGGAYFVEIRMEKREAANFLLELWEHVDERTAPANAEYSLDELTDRMRDFRTRFEEPSRVLIYTHSWAPRGDRNTLHRDVIEFLESKGMVLAPFDSLANRD